MYEKVQMHFRSLLLCGIPSSIEGQSSLSWMNIDDWLLWFEIPSDKIIFVKSMKINLFYCKNLI